MPKPVYHQPMLPAENAANNRFTCPYCHTLSQHIWNISRVLFTTNAVRQDLKISRCALCQKETIWLNGSMIHPRVLGVDDPNDDLALDIQGDYREAALILRDSPRGAAALLRLCVQKLCVQLGQAGKSIDADIKALVAKGLDPRIQQALDIVRVVGNDSVHPGVVDLNDTPDVAQKLFGLVNMIAEHMITQPKEIASLYATLPADKLGFIEDRDKKALTPPTV